MNELPKVISVFCTENGNLQRATYIVRSIDENTNKLSYIFSDLRTLFHLPPMSTTQEPLILCDMNGSKIKTFHELYTFSPTTFVLTTAQHKDECITNMLKLTQTRGASAQQRVKDVKQTQKQTNDSKQVWMYGHSRLHEKDTEKLDEKDTKENVETQPIVQKSRIPRCATMQTKAQQNRNRQTDALNLEKSKEQKPPVKKKRDKSKTKKKRSPSKTKPSETAAAPTGSEPSQPSPPIDTQIEEVEQPVPAVRPQTKSQIEAQGDRVRELQDQMSNGESFLDKIGRAEPRRQRTTSSIFGPIAENLDPAPLDQSVSFRPVNGNRNTAPYIPGWSVVIEPENVTENGAKGESQKLHNPHSNSKPNKNPSTLRSRSVTNVNVKQRRVSINDVSDVEDTTTAVPEYFNDPVPVIRPGTVTLKKRASVNEEQSDQESES